MPNGGFHFCAKCNHFDGNKNVCTLRGVIIEIPYQTTCRNFNEPAETVRGPLYAMVSESSARRGWHIDLPYYDGCRVETAVKAPSDEAELRYTDELRKGDTVVRFTDRAGKTHEFPSGESYLQFYLASGGEL